MNNIMKIISWDVGVKNMAYCMIDKSVDEAGKESFKIDNWGIINLVDKRDVCTFELRNKKTCGKIARFKVPIGETESIVCKTHADKVKVNISDSKSKKCVKCNADATKSILDKDEWSWCDKHINLSKKVLSQFKAKKITGQNCSQQPVQTLVTELVKKLDEHPEFLNVNTVLIENQPSLINPVMKSIASSLYAYFVMRGIIDKKENKIELVKYVSPSNKLKIEKSTTEKSLNEGKTKRDVYDITKGLGRIYCRNLISTDECKLLDKLNEANNGKEDDLCDSFLQGFQYLFPTIPQQYIDKLESIDGKELDVDKVKKKKKVSKKETSEGNEDNGENNDVIVPAKTKKNVKQKK